MSKLIEALEILSSLGEGGLAKDSIMDVNEMKDNIAALEAQVKEKDEQIEAAMFSGTLGEIIKTQKEQIATLEAQIKKFEAQIKKYKMFVQENYPSDHWDLVIEKKKLQEQIAALKADNEKKRLELIEQNTQLDDNDELRKENSTLTAERDLWREAHHACDKDNDELRTELDNLQRECERLKEILNKPHVNCDPLRIMGF